MSAAKPRSPVASHRINFINKDDTGCVLLPLHKEIPDPGGPHTDKHFHKIRPTDTEKGDIRFPRDGLGKERFPRSGRPHQENPLRDAAPEAGKFLRILEEFDDLLKLFLGLFDPRHILKGYLLFRLREDFRAALSEREGLSPPHLHLPHEKDPHGDQQQHGKPGYEDRLPQGRLLRRLGGDLHSLPLKKFNKIRIVGGIGRKGRAIRRGPLNLIPLDYHGCHIPRTDPIEEIAEDNLFLRRLRLVKDVEHKNHKKTYQQPKGQVSVKWVHFFAVFSFHSVISLLFIYRIYITKKPYFQ